MKVPQRAPLALGVLLALALARPGRAEPPGLDPALEAKLHLKVLSYDRNLKARAGGKLVIGVVFRAGGPDAERGRAALVAAFQKVAQGLTVQGMSPTVVTVPYDAGALGQRLRAAGVTVVYVAPGLEGEAAAISQAAAGVRATTLSGSRAGVSSGFACGVVAEAGKPRIVINLKVARKLGMDLDPKVLSLADVIK